MNNDRYLTFALGKGRLANKTLELLEKTGITCEEMKDKNSRKLIFVNEELKLRFFLAKGPDVPTYVEYGAADIGVVGSDTIMEENRRVYEVLDLGFGKCRMCVCGPAQARELLKHHERIRVASKYPNIAKDYFFNKKHQTVDIIKLNGSVELGPIVGLSDVIVDIVETGSTLRENGLEVLEEICPLSARKELLLQLQKRSPSSYGGYEQTVNEIIENVRQHGDKALFDYTEKFDHCSLSRETVQVTREEIEEAYTKISPEFVAVMKKSAENIRAFHEKQLHASWIIPKEDGTILGQKILPIAISGVYVPGGKAAYPSSVLMNVLPAKVAGVSRIIMTTPPGKDGKVNPGTLVAADIAGVDEIYKVGGAQAIAAMAFGTESVPKVDKITGPGNIFVALAKKACFGFVSIDSIAGPSEILVLADESANPRYVAADLLSQAEHDELASAILITTSRELADQVVTEIGQFTEKLERKAIIQASLDNYGTIFLADSMEDAIYAANEIASEHLEILTKNPFETMTKIKNAGAIFLGEYSSEPLGDYFAGPNHILPTNGTAKFFSPLNVDDFMKKTSIISYSKDALARVHKDIELFAKEEGLTAHANSIKVRFEEE